MERIKVAEVITRLDRGGAPEILGAVFKALPRERFLPKLIIGETRFPSESAKRLLECPKDVFLIPQLKRRINLLNDLVSFIKLYRLFRREKFAIVHTHTAKAGVLARIAARLAGVPCIIHQPHGHNFYGYFGPVISRTVVLLERLLAVFSDRIIAVTELEKMDFVRFKVCVQEKIVVIHNGLNLSKYAAATPDKPEEKNRLGIKDDECVVGFIGRLEPVKGIKYFIDSLPLIVKDFSNIRFLIAGDGALRKKMEARAIARGIYGHCIFTGWIEDVPAALSVLDILVLPSLNEAAGITLIEAQASGVAIVASNVGGISEVIRDKETGILIPPARPLELAEAVSYLLKNKEIRLRMGEAGKEWVKAKFGLEEMTEKIFGLYKEMANLCVNR